MAARFSPQDVLETEVKRRLGPHVQRRGDGFTEAESMGMLQLVRAHWREGWDVIAQLHNQQFSNHNRSADSLKKKFSRLYRSNIPVRGAKNHQAITFAHVVHKEMIEGIPSAPDAAVEDEQAEHGESSSQPPPSEVREQEGRATESDQSWVDSVSEVPPPTVTSLTTTPGASSITTPSAATARARLRVPRQTPEWRNSAVVFPPEATPLPSDDLLTSVLKVILRSQYQRDLDREEERIRREEERQRRREEDELRRQAEDHRRDEEREERRRRSEERAEERDENRRRHEQFMQMMMLLVGKNSTTQQRNTEC